MKNLYQKIAMVLSICFTLIGYSQNTYVPDWVIKQAPLIIRNEDASNVYIVGDKGRDTLFYHDQYAVKYKVIPNNTEHTLITVENEEASIFTLHRDQEGNFYIAGVTTQTENFATPNVYKSTFETIGNGNGCGFIAKYSGNGQLLWRTYTFVFSSGGGYDLKWLTTDGDGNVYFVEYIPYTIVLENAPFQSTVTLAETIHPIADQTAPAITKLNSDGQLVWSTFYCNQLNMVRKLVATENRIWLLGFTQSRNDFVNTNPNFYATPDAPITNQDISEEDIGDSNEYLSAFDFDGNRVFSTYLWNTTNLGTNNIKTLQAGSNQVYLVYNNDINNLPILEDSVVWGSAYRISAFDDDEGYLYTVNTDCQVLGVGSNNRMFLVGKTQSTAFPVTEEAYQPEKAIGINSNGQENFDAYIQIVDANATQNLYSSYFGESGYDSFDRVFPVSSGYYVLGGTWGNSSNDAVITAPPYLDPYTNPQSGNITYGGEYLARFSPSPLGITQPTIKGLSVFPNPVENQLTLAAEEGFTSDFTFEWFNLQGQKIPLKIQKTPTAVHWQVESLATGVYLLKVTKGTAQQTFKIVKK